LEGSKYKIGQLVACYYKTIPPTQWDPFVEGRPGIITSVKTSVGKASHGKLRYYYEVAVTSCHGKLINKTINEENLVPFENVPTLGQEIDELVMNYYKKSPLTSTD